MKENRKTQVVITGCQSIRMLGTGIYLRQHYRGNKGAWAGGEGREQDKEPKGSEDEVPPG